MGDDTTDRVEGVDFGDINPVLERISFPITTAELAQQYGDHELGRTNADPISIRELFEYMGDDTFESAPELREMILGQMPRDSGGRTNYSDRGGSHPMHTDAAREAAEQTTADLQNGEATDPDTTQR